MIAINSAEYVNLKRSLHREYTRSFDEDRQRFVSAVALLRRTLWALEPVHHLLDLGYGSWHWNGVP